MDFVVFKGSYPSNPFSKQATLESPPHPLGLRLVKDETVAGVRFSLPPAATNGELVGEGLESCKPVSGFWQLGNVAVVVVFKAKGFNGGERTVHRLPTEHNKTRGSSWFKRSSCKAIINQTVGLTKL